jgi:hypothetical protein
LQITARFIGLSGANPPKTLWRYPAQQRTRDKKNPVIIFFPVSENSGKVFFWIHYTLEKYQQKGKKIYLLGIEFSRDKKNIQHFICEDEIGMMNAEQEKSQDM